MGQKGNLKGHKFWEKKLILKCKKSLEMQSFQTLYKMQSLFKTQTKSLKIHESQKNPNKKSQT